MILIVSFGIRNSLYVFYGFVLYRELYLIIELDVNIKNLGILYINFGFLAIIYR